MFLEDFLKKLYVDQAEAINKLSNDLGTRRVTNANIKMKAMEYGLNHLYEYPPHLASIEGQEMQWIPIALKKLTNMVRAFVSNSTFCDWQERKGFVKDMVSTMTPLKQILDVFLKAPGRIVPTEVLKIDKALTELLNVRHLVILFDPLEKNATQNNGQNLDEMIKESTNKVSTSDSKLVSSIVKLARDLGANKKDRNEVGMQYFFTSLIWKTNLMIDTRLLISNSEKIKTEEIIAIQKILCRWNLQKQFKEILQPIMNDKSHTTGLFRRVTGTVASGIRSALNPISSLFKSDSEKVIYSQKTWNKL